MTGFTGARLAGSSATSDSGLAPRERGRRSVSASAPPRDTRQSMTTARVRSAFPPKVSCSMYTPGASRVLGATAMT